MDPKNTIEVGEGDAKTLLNLIEALDDHDDVDGVHANFDISEEVMERVLA
jgi:transcriptional/translational regulatory protein YebC/TACO1